MVETVQTLIDKTDTQELVRDQIAVILAENVVAQMALAVTAGKDPELWNLTIYTERFQPLENALNITSASSGPTTPIVNVYFDSSDDMLASSNFVDRQQKKGTYRIDVYGFGIAQEDGAGGQIPGDFQASINCQRAARLVRNIIMASINTHLQLKGVVANRYFRDMTQMRPNIGENPVQEVIAMRMALDVTFNEFSPQYDAGILEKVVVDINQSLDGQVIATDQVEYDYT